MVRRAKIDRVLVATDFSPACDAAVRYALGLASQFNAQLYLLHVLPQAAAARGASEPEATSHLQRLRNDLLHEHEHCVTAVLTGDPATRIVEKAHDVEADLIVLGTQRGPTCPSQASSVVDRVVSSAPCPVLAVRWAAPSATRRAAWNTQRSRA